MAIHYYLDGVEVEGRIRVTNTGDGGLAGLTSSANGSDGGVGGVVIDDPLGELDIKGFRPFYVEEDEATPSRIFTGFIGARRVDKMDVAGPGRTWDCDLRDLNLIPTLQCWRNIKLGPQTDLERIAWMLAHWPATDWPVYDNGEVYTVSARNFDEIDLDGMFPDEVISALLIDVRMSYIYWDPDAPSGEEISLLYQPIETARGTATVSLSNDPSDDIDNETIFSAWVWPKLTREPGFTYSGVYFKYTKGKIYRVNETTATTYIRRDLVYETDRISSPVTASNRVDRLLARASTEKDVVTCTVMVRNDQVNLIQEGYRIPVKFLYLPGYESGDAVVIVQRTIRRPENGNQDYYLLDLELSNSAPNSVGEGGDPGEFPHPQATPGIVQFKYGVAQPGNAMSVTLDSVPGAGNLLVAWQSTRSTFPSGIPTGWTLGPDGVIDPGLDGGRWIYRAATATEIAAVVVAVQEGVDIQTSLWELEGVSLAPDASVSNSVDTTVFPTSISAGTLNATAAGIALLGFSVHSSDGGVSVTMTPGAGWTEKADIREGGFHPVHWSAERTVAAAAALSTTTQLDWPADLNYKGDGGQGLFFAAASVSSLPSPGQPVGPETVTMSGDDGTTIHPFADGSLRVFVDNVDQTAAITTQDGATGTFTLAFTPRPSETVTVFYQGR